MWNRLQAALHSPVAEPARACMSRGYRVEQEASTVAAIERILLTSQQPSTE